MRWPASLLVDGKWPRSTVHPRGMEGVGRGPLLGASRRNHCYAGWAEERKQSDMPEDMVRVWTL